MNEITASDFLSSIDKLVDEGKLNKVRRDVLLHDMSDILDKIHENADNCLLPQIIQVTDRKMDWGVYTSSYKRTYYLNNIIQSETFWTSEGFRSRKEGKPAYMEYYPDGKTQRCHYMLEGKPYREGNKPVMEVYNEDGSLREESWYNRRKREFLC